MRITRKRESSRGLFITSYSNGYLRIATYMHAKVASYLFLLHPLGWMQVFHRAAHWYRLIYPSGTRDRNGGGDSS